jgi:hypothetical protein
MAPSLISLLSAAADGLMFVFVAALLFYKVRVSLSTKSFWNHEIKFYCGTLLFLLIFLPFHGLFIRSCRPFPEKNIFCNIVFVGNILPMMIASTIFNAAMLHHYEKICLPVITGYFSVHLINSIFAKSSIPIVSLDIQCNSCHHFSKCCDNCFDWDNS